MQGYLLIYIFACFSLGIACASVTVLSALRRGDRLAWSFLVFYSFVSVLVIGALLRAFIDLLPDPVSPATRFAVEYLDSFVGRYGLMFSLPFFVHRVFAVADARRDYLIGTIVVSAAVVQHFTEFRLSKAWDDRGDLFEDLLNAGIVLYAVGLGFVRRKAPGVHQPLATRLLALLSIGLPTVFYDLFVSDDSALKFFPLWYCVGSVVVTWTLMQRRPVAPTGSVSPNWGLSEREAEVAAWVLQGQSNKEIAAKLNISTNTVKTHLRSIFDKSGYRSRFELIAAVHRGTANDTDR